MKAELNPRLSGVKKYQHPVYAGTYFISCDDALRLLDRATTFATTEASVDQLAPDEAQAAPPSCDDCVFNKERRCVNPAGVVKKTVDLPDGFGCTMHNKGDLNG